MRVRLAVLVLGLGACGEPHMGYPEMPIAGEMDVVSWPPAGCFDEREPNDSGEYEVLGVLHRDSSYEICANMSSTGVDSNDNWAGDVDVFTFELIKSAEVTVTLDPVEESMLYMSLDWESEEGLYLYTDQVETWSHTFQPGVHIFYVAGYSGPRTDYTVRLELR